MASSHQGKFHIPRRVSSASVSPSVSSSSYRGSREPLSAIPSTTTTNPHYQQHQQHEYHEYHDHHANSYVTDGRGTATTARQQPPRTDDRIPLPIQSNTTAAATTTPEEKIILSTIAETSPPNGNSPMASSRMHDTRSGAATSGGDFRFQPELRERASSPLLGQSDRRNRLRRAPAASHLHPQHYPSSYTKKPLRASESTSALHETSSSSSSYYYYDDDPLRLPPTTASPPLQEPMTGAAPGHPDLSSRPLAPLTSHSATDLKSASQRDDMAPIHQWERQNASTKSKFRPMMDLSRLFPKPRDESPRLLSPTRMMASPSPVSMVSEESSSRTHRSHAPRNKLSRNRPARDSISLHREQLQELGAEERMQSGWRDQDQPQEPQIHRENDYAQHAQHGQYERRKVPKPFREEDSNNWKRKPGFSNWFDGPQFQVSDDEDSGVDIDSETQVREDWPPEDLYASRSVYSNANGHSSSLSDRRSALSGSSSRTLQPASNQNGWAGSIKTRPSSTVRTPSTITERERPLRSHPPQAAKSSPSVQGQKAPFGSSNLNEFSVLCLSSDDEEEEQEEEAADNGITKSENRTFMRDSVASFDDGEVYTAKAAVATTRKPSIRSVKANTASQSKSSTRPSPPSLEFHLAREPSKRSQASSERRSRFLAVTRQEEFLLEALRRNKGALPSSFFNDNDSVNGSDADGHGSGAARKSTVGDSNAEASFLRLSVGGPPPRWTPRPTAGTSEEQTGSRRGGGGVEPDYGDHNTEHSVGSPRISLIHSDAMPSPSTALTSPRTPTSMSAAQRFSLQSPHPPPNYSPPPVPDHNHNRHSRTRTGSSGALAPKGNKDENEKGIEHGQDLPIWALGWNQELGGEIAVAH